MKRCIVTPEGKHLQDPWDVAVHVYETVPMLGTDGKLPIEILPTAITAGIVSNPPTGCKKIVNIYVNQAGKVVVIYDDTPV